jgi:hypothetical protein
MMVDLIILVAEAALFVAHHDKWKTRHKAWLWSVMFTALGVSTGANTGHVHSTDYLSHLTAALPPVALMFTMTVGFGVMKRTFMNKPITPARPAERVETPAVRTVLTPVASPPESPSHPEVSPAEIPAISEDETIAVSLPESLSTTETFAAPDFKVIPGKSFTAPRDRREGLSLPELRVRDMYDVNPDISVNAVKDALGVAWATANKYLKATKDARTQTA